MSVRALAAAGVAAGSLIGGGVGYSLGAPGGGPGSSPERTAYSFVYSIRHGNFARACSYVASSVKTTNDECATNVIGNTGFAMVFGGSYPWAGYHVVSGSRKDVDDHTVTFDTEGPKVGKATLVVVRQDSGRWRITEVRTAV